MCNHLIIIVLVLIAMHEQLMIFSVFKSSIYRTSTTWNYDGVWMIECLENISHWLLLLSYRTLCEWLLSYRRQKAHTLRYTSTIGWCASMTSRWPGRICPVSCLLSARRNRSDSLYLSKLCPDCIRAVSVLYSGCNRAVSELYPECIQNVSVLYSGCNRAVSGLYPSCIRTVSRLYLGCIRVVFGLYLYCIRVISWLYFSCILVISRLYQGCIQAVFGLWFRLYRDRIYSLFRSFGTFYFHISCSEARFSMGCS